MINIHAYFNSALVKFVLFPLFFLLKRKNEISLTFKLSQILLQVFKVVFM